MENTLYTVEEKIHYMTINGKPVFSIKYYFFIDVKTAKEHAKVLRTKIPYNYSQSKVRTIKFTASNFNWFRISKHTAICNGVENHFYCLTGHLTTIHPNTGERILIDTQFDVTTGAIIEQLLNN